MSDMQRIATVLIADTLPEGRELALVMGLRDPSTLIATRREQIRGLALHPDARVMDRTLRMGSERKAQILSTIEICKMVGGQRREWQAADDAS